MQSLVEIVMVYSFAIESMIRGHHEYKHVWENPSEDDELVCEREIGNAHDTHAVAIRKDIDGEKEKFLHFVLFLLDAVVRFVAG